MRSNPYSTEARANLRLALPLIGAQLSFVSAATVDAIFAGRLGARELAAVAVGSNAWFMVFVLFMGISMAVSPIVAHRLGAGRSPQDIGGFLRGAFLIAILLGLAWTSIMFLTGPLILSFLDLDAITHSMASDYLKTLAWTGLPFTLCFFLRNGAEGHSLIKVPLIAGIIGLMVNAGFDWLLMYGHWGFPAMGPEGCGWATVISGWAMVAVYLGFYRGLAPLKALNLAGGPWLKLESQHLEVLRLGLPIAAMLTAEAWLFSIGSLMVARFGADLMAAHQIAINFAALCFMVPTAIGMATTVRVGLAAGAGDQIGVALRGRVGILMGLGFACCSATLMALAPGLIVAVYTDVAHLAEPAVHFLAFAALFQVFDCIQATSNGALRGVKDSYVPMLITLAAYWFGGMPLAAGLAFGLEMGPSGIWWGFVFGLGLAAAGLCTRFLRRGQRLAAQAREAQDKAPRNFD